MHGILATVNEYQSREAGADIAYKMGQKARNGGTIERAKLGYSTTSTAPTAARSAPSSLTPNARPSSNSDLVGDVALVKARVARLDEIAAALM